MLEKFVFYTRFITKMFLVYHNENRLHYLTFLSISLLSLFLSENFAYLMVKK